MPNKSLRDENRRLQAMVADRDAIIEDQKRRITDLEQQVLQFASQLESLLGGKKRTPELPPGPGLFPDLVAEVGDGDDESNGDNESDEEDDKPKPGAGRNKDRKRGVDTTGLAQRDVIHELPESERYCPVTGLRLVPVSEKVSVEIDYIRGRFEVVNHRQVIYGLPPEDAKDRMVDEVTAPRPRALPGVAASAMLVAWILVQKYANHIPLHRQVRIFERDGLRLPKQTLCDWVMAASRRLRPIVDRLFGMIRAGPVMQLDDTPVRCQAGRGETHFTARIWTFVNPEVGGVVYRFTAGRSCDELKRHLEGFRGTLGGDGYRGNHAAADRVDGDIRHAGCWAHVIRKFRDAGKEDPSVAGLFCGDIKKLFDIEREASSRQLDARDHLALRQERSRTVLAAIIWRARRLRDHYSDAGDMAQAIGYLLNQRRALTHFLSDSRIPIENNACERAIRPVAVGRRNWLFAGSMCGGRAAAVIYSLVESCKIAGVNPVDYLADVLVRVGDADKQELLQLIPANWTPAAPQPVDGLAEPALA